jgi:hypothetical protein
MWEEWTGRWQGKLDMNSPDFEEENMMIFMGTPEECWKAIRDVNSLARNLSRRKVVSEPKLRRSFAKKFYLNEKGERVEVKRGQHA